MIAESIFPYLSTMFSAVVQWFDQIMTAVGGKFVVLSAFLIVLVVSLLFIPLRGRGLASGIASYTFSKVNARRRFSRYQDARKHYFKTH